MSIEQKKYQLIEAIISMSDTEILEQHEQFFGQPTGTPDSLNNYIKPTKATTDFNEILKEQGHRRISTDEWKDIVKRMSIQEPLEELIKDI